MSEENKEIKGEEAKPVEGMVIPGGPESWKGIIQGVDSMLNGGSKVQAEAQVKIHEKEVEDRKHARFFNSIIAGTVILFLMAMISALLFINKDTDNGMKLLSLFVGLVAGFMGGTGWQKAQNKQ